MELTPGCIIAEAQVKTRDLHGRYWVGGGGVKGYIHPEYIPSGWQLRKGNKVVNLVCLPRQRSQPFAISNYESNLIQYFYSRRGRIVDEANKSDIWVPRWREGAMDPSQISFHKSKPEMALPPSPECGQWQFIETPRWTMPISTSQYFDASTESFIFCPSTLQKCVFPYILPAGYKNVEIELDKPPLNFQANLTLNMENKEAKLVRIYLHGFLKPLKLHLLIWKHMLSGALGANRNEKKWWASWLGFSMPSSLEVSNIFQGCVQKTKHICQPCSLEQFTGVQNSIAYLVKKYWDSLVNFWESTSTKKVVIYPTDLGFCEAEIFIMPEEPLHLSGDRFCPFLILDGWSYDWENTQEEAVFHFAPSTFFLKDKLPAYYLRRINCIRGDLHNVKRV